MRRRAGSGEAFPLASLGWLSWIQLGAWLWWLVALPPSRIAALFSFLPVHSGSGLLMLVGGALVFCVPPRVASAIALAVLRPCIDPDPPASSGLPGFLLRNLSPHFALAILVGFLVTGMALSPQDPSAPIVALVMGLVVALVVRALFKQGGLRKLTFLEAEEFRARTMEIARQGGVRLNGVVVFQHRHFHQANAFAHRLTRYIAVSDRLIRNLTKREVDAVVAHELGHLRGWPGIYLPNLYWMYLPIYFAFWVVMRSTSDFESAEPFIAFPAVVAVIVSAYICRSRELSADVRSARVSGDSHGMIAALARIARLNREPAAWGRIEGLILTHPSLTTRALSLAARFQFPPSRALAIVADPDTLEGGPAAAASRYPIGAQSPHGEVAFSQTAKTAHIQRSILVFPVCLVIPVFALTYAVYGWLPAGGFFPQDAVFLLGLPLVLWSTFRLSFWWHARFVEKMTRRIGAHLPAESEGDFVGLLPADAMQPVQGFYSWDLGRLNLSGDRFVYVGERARFSLPRDAIVSIETIAGPLAWSRKHGVLVRWQGGSFIVQTLKAGSRREAAQLQREWSAWWKADGGVPPLAQASPELALPDLPVLDSQPPSRGLRLMSAVPQLGGVLLFGSLISFLRTDKWLWNLLAILAAAFLYVVAVSPMFIASGSRRDAALGPAPHP
jgi:Zn-dependent protease with chaperone function